MNYEFIGLVVSILVPVISGLFFLSKQMKGVKNELKADIKDVRSELHAVRDELKADIKRVEDKLDNKERDLRQDFKSDLEKLSTEVIAQKMEIQRGEFRNQECAKEMNTLKADTHALKARFNNLVSVLKRTLPQLEV